MSAVEPKRGRRMRTRWLVVGIVAVALVVYLGVVALYAASGRPLAMGDPSTDSAPEDVVVGLTVKSVNAGAEHIVMDVSVNPPDSMIDKQATMTQDLTVLIMPVDGEQSVTLKAGTIPSTSTLNFYAGGSIENWPFDRYEAGIPGDAVASGIVIIAFKTVDGAKVDLPTRVVMTGNVPGWNFDAGLVQRPDLGTVTGPTGVEEPITAVTLTASRSGSTLAFGIVLLGLLVVVPVLVLIVAILAFTGKRKVEATLMSWMGAMLFATIPLRGFLPGSPPIGSWIDFLIVLWVIVALVTGLGIYVAAWVRWNGPATKPTRPAHPEPPES